MLRRLLFEKSPKLRSKPNAEGKAGRNGENQRSEIDSHISIGSKWF
jgi:hypothetical protein